MTAHQLSLPLHSLSLAALPLWMQGSQQQCSADAKKKVSAVAEVAVTIAEAAAAAAAVASAAVTATAASAETDAALLADAARWPLLPKMAQQGLELWMVPPSWEASRQCPHRRDRLVAYGANSLAKAVGFPRCQRVETSLASSPPKGRSRRNFRCHHHRHCHSQRYRGQVARPRPQRSPQRLRCLG